MADKKGHHKITL